MTAAEALVRELLAVIHRDGGQYTETHGIARATADAVQRVLRERSLARAYRDAERDVGEALWRPDVGPESYANAVAAENEAREALDAALGTP